MHSEQHYLSTLFEPRCVAIIGASEKPGSIGATLARNILDNATYKGRVFFVNPRHDKIFGQATYASVDQIPQRIDVAVLCTRATLAPDILEACGRAGCRYAILIAGGFSEIGPRGANLERKVLSIARAYDMRIVGPNCLGLIRPTAGVNLSFVHGNAQPGSIGFISQSGALCAAILDWAAPNNVGFSTVVSLGAESDIDFGEVLDFMVADPRTESIFLYIEGIKNARRFMSALRAAARCKPVLLIKTGRHTGGELAALAHTGALTGADDVFDAALRRAGVVRLYNIGQMFAAAQALFSHFRPSGNRLAVITNGGGPGVMAADHAASLGIPLAQLSEATQKALNAILPPTWSKTNPMDILGDADPQRYAAALQACLDDEGVDGVLVILTPQAMSDPTQAARQLIDIAKQSSKPIVTCWMGEAQVREARLLFKGAGIPTFRTPDPAVELFSHISAYYRNQKLLMQAPSAIADHIPPRLESSRLVIESALSEGRKVLNEIESKALLAAFRIPIAHTVIARSATEAMVLSEEIGLPVVMKVNAANVINKGEVRGVRLNLGTLVEVRDAYASILESVPKCKPDAQINGVAIEPMIKKTNGRELAIGIFRDDIFGPTIYLAPGGSRARRVDGQRIVGLPPLNPYLAADMINCAAEMARLNAWGEMPPVDRPALEAILLRVSEMACEMPWISSLDINPLIIDEHGAVAVDASIGIRNPPLTADIYDHVAIHPYPAHLITRYQTKTGEEVTIRPIRPEDAEIEQEFVRGLSAESRYMRFMNSLSELTPVQLVRLTQIDYDREMAFVATTPQAAGETQVGVARYAINPDGESCEFAIVVADDWQGKGLARRLMGVIIEAARNRGLKTMCGDYLAENARMLAFVQSLGFVLSPHPEDSGLKRGILKLD
jgi:acetyltransferase